MAPAPRKSTGRAAPSRKGAAPAVSDPGITVESENIVELDPAAEDLAALVEEHNTEVHDASDAPATDIPAPVDEPVTDVDGDDAPNDADAIRAGAEAETKPRDMAVLARLADTSGRSAVTPYPGANGPSPVRLLPPLRDTHRWVREGDATATARVVVDGWRVHINGIPRFAGKGDRVTAPADVIAAAITRGTLVADPTEQE